MNSLRELLRDDVHRGARALLGSRLIRGDRVSRIVEVEAYRTPDDPGCHAHRGMTPRNRPMYEDAGTAYVYFSYGMHWMLNIVAHRPDDAAAVLIRAAEPLKGLERMSALRRNSDRHALLSGPGKIGQAYELSAVDNYLDLLDQGDFRIELSEPPTTIIQTPRIGLASGKGDKLPWRYVDADAGEWLSYPIHRSMLSKISDVSAS